MFSIPSKLDLYITQDNKVIIYAPLQESQLSQLQTTLRKSTPKITKTPLEELFQKHEGSAGIGGSGTGVSEKGGVEKGYFEQQKNSTLTGKVLAFSNKDGSFEIDSQYDDYGPTLGSYQTEFKIHGIAGLLDLGFGKYLFYIKKRHLVAQMGDKMIFQILEADSVTVYRKPYLTLMEEQQEYESIGSILNILSSGQMYFSYDYDLTNTTKKSFETLNPFTFDTPMNQVANDLYYWNRFLQLPFLESQLDCTEFIMPIICGYVGSFSTALPLDVEASSYRNAPTVNIDIVLISRMNKKRVGTRYNRRGLDQHGYAAIFVETELVLYSDKRITSFLMTRGSCPYFWSQSIDLSYKPQIEICKNETQSHEAFCEHFGKLADSYGAPVICFNLLNHLGYEALLNRKYEETMQQLKEEQPELKDLLFYESFDINYDPGVFDKLNRAIDLYLNQLDFLHIEFGNGYSLSPQSSVQRRRSGTFMQQQSPQVLSFLQKQTGVFRINCLDCLDRTNMIQYMIACNVLLRMLTTFNIKMPYFYPGDTLERKVRKVLGQKWIDKFKLLWVDNGNAMARVYTGTNALNSLFILTGKYGVRHDSLTGKLRDLFYAIGRYYLNNFADAFKQDDFDLFLGNNRGTLFTTDHPVSNSETLEFHQPLSAQEFSNRIQKLQRKQSFSLIKNTDCPALNASNNIIIRYFKSMVLYCTQYLGLLLRHFAPRKLQSYRDWLFAFVFLYLVTIWRIFCLPFLGRKNKWQWRTPKSGHQRWEGDETPITVE